MTTLQIIIVLAGLGVPLVLIALLLLALARVTAALEVLGGDHDYHTGEAAE